MNKNDVFTSPGEKFVPVDDGDVEAANETTVESVLHEYVRTVMLEVTASRADWDALDAISNVASQRISVPELRYFSVRLYKTYLAFWFDPPNDASIQGVVYPYDVPKSLSGGLKALYKWMLEHGAKKTKS